MKRRTGHVGLIICLVLAFLVGAGLWAIFEKDALHTFKVIPPLPTSHNCSEVAVEIAKYDWDRELALAVAKAESQCNVAAHGDEDLIYQAHGRNYGYSVGLFQVRILPGREDCDVYDISTNVACAYRIYQAKGDFSPWSGYTSGKYQRYFWHSLL